MLKALGAATFAVSLAAAFAASGAHAAGASSLIHVDSVTSKVRVAVNDIDFTNPDQVGVLYGRLRDASKVVCETTEPGPAFRLADDRACEREAVQGAVRDLNQPRLTEMDARMSAQTAEVEDETARAHDRRRETR
ncbi:MAG: UrcA family protein [Asticcacaulis sp.]